MAYEVSYHDDNTGRRAIIDFCRYVGLNRAVTICRAMRDATRFCDLDGADCMASFCGVSGEPIHRMIAHYHGEAVLAQWLDAPMNDASEF